MAKLSTYTSLTSVPALTDTIPITTGGQTKNVPVQNLIRKTYITVGQSGSFSDYICDGIADDVELQAAITAANGLVAVFIRGSATNYDITNTITIPSNSVITGDASAILKANASLSTSVNMLENSDKTGGNTNIHISNISLDGNETNRTGKVNGRDEAGHNLLFKKVTYSTITNVNAYNGASACITLAQGCSDNVVEKCRIYGSWNHNLLVCGSRTGSVECTRNAIKNNIVYNAGQTGNTQGVGIELANFATNNTISGNLSKNNLEGGIHVYWFSNQNTIYGNQCISNNQNGISIVNKSDYTVVSNNVIIGSTKVGIDATDTSTYNQECIMTGNLIKDCGWNGIRANLASDFTTSIISNNKIISCGLTAPVGNGQEGIYLNVSTGTIVANNQISFSGRRGIYLHTPTAVQVLGNNIYSNPTEGINADGATSCIFSNNIIHDNNTYGVLLQRDASLLASTYNILNGNIIYSNTSGGIVELTASNFNIITSNNCHGNVTSNLVTVGASDVIANNIST
jgi:parallel beta-helix repeat protein